MSLPGIERLKGYVNLPIIMAPMFLVSNTNMVINACKSGILGSFPALNARTEETLDNWMKEINEELKAYETIMPDKKVAPWAVNFIAHRTNKRYREDLGLIKKHQPPIVITSLGDPSPVVQVVQDYGGLVFSDVINIKLAKKAIEKGSDGLILISAGAGGHGGTYNPFAFIHEVRTFWDGPIILGGGLTKGEDILAAEAAGADFVYMGSNFIPSTESTAVPGYKQMVVDSSIEDIIYTDVFSGINANYLIPSIVKAGIDVNQLEDMKRADISKIGKADVKAWKDIWGAGQGIGAIKNQLSVAEIVDELQKEYLQAKERVIVNSREMGVPSYPPIH
ncbi:nitronate monooxygenase [Lentibacillus persicus]|uniref:Probable nitronate monooxygenase n=1 Tax=Lentibacillus persicus TaxID=640948 RepID=A0A1I1SAX8_9BACI|nr:nitronate monooxygenase [Lentibacillus persicus]SFD43665.1 nitronate monooxygenase [Lentibacillus persicus]